MIQESKLDPPRPLCFDSDEEFIGWCKAARRVHEYSSPCDDCAEHYKVRMGLRCEEVVVREIFIINVKTKPRGY